MDLSVTPFCEGTLSFLAKDMSPRIYHRLTSLDTTYVVMQCLEKDILTRFLNVTNYLSQYNLRVPQIIHTGEDYVILEDFGDATFQRCFDHGACQETFLKIAIDVLKHLQRHATHGELPLYTHETLLDETALFLTGTLPLIDRSPALLEDDFREICARLLNDLPEIPQTCVLRDYHVDNLMHCGQDSLSVASCGLLDYQDALWGPCIYDVMSLIEDARRSFSPSLRKDLWAYFLYDILSQHHADYRRVADVWGILRHLRIIGVFSRYAWQEKNTSKLIHVPRVWGYVDRLLEKETLSSLRRWIHAHPFLRVL